ncbi:MAG TPA: M24 family metallopeptidase [Acidimicrobiales bacterium]
MSTLADPSRVDDAGLRADRRRRLFAAMAERDLDVLVLGRPADVAFASGARQLWTAGSRPFGPACVAVLATGHTHLLSVSDHDVPPEVGHDDLFGLSWNPAILAASLARVPGLREARRVGTTSSTPGFPRLLAAVAPGAEVVDGSAAAWAARTPKSAAEVARITAAVAIAEAGLAAMVDALRPGATERGLVGAYLEAIASLGAPTPPTEGVACATPTRGPVALRRIATAAPIDAGQLVVLDPGAFHRGYEGGVGRTRVTGGAATDRQRALARRCRVALDAVVATCRAGATGGDLVAAWTSSGEALPAAPLAHGMGLGVEPPIIGAGVGSGGVLAAGTVLALTGWVAEEGVGGFLERDLVLVAAGDPRVLTTSGRGPAGEGA